MKVDNNITLYAGGQPEDSRAAEGIRREQDERKTVFAGNLNHNQGMTLQDRIAERKAKAQEKAMKAVSDAFQGDLKIDEGMEESRQHVKELTEEQEQLRDGMEDVEKREETLKQARENGEVSEEEYLQEMESLQQERMAQEQKIGRNQAEIQGENASIRSTRMGLLSRKVNPMKEAQDQKDEIMAAARDQVLGMIVQEGMDHVDEEAEKREEQAEEIREERKEREELLEKQKEKREEQETMLEEMDPKEISNLTKSSEDVKKEVQDMLREMNLLSEDIKGAAVDETL